MTARMSLIRGWRDLGLPPPMPCHGPFRLEDVLGMGSAVTVLLRSLDKGRYESHVQFETFRGARSTMANLSRSSALTMGDAVGAFARQRVWLSSSPLDSI